MGVPVYFYLPRAKWLFDEEPAAVDQAFVDEVSQRFFNGPSWSWTLQTYLRVRNAGFPCRLVDRIPDEGVILAARGDLPYAYRPSARQLIACMLATGGETPWSQVQVAQNPLEASSIAGGLFMPHWPQPGLVPRDRGRGGRLENVAFFGHPDQLAEELKRPEWEEFLGSRGLNWLPIHKDSPRRNDYSDIDLVVAIRSFDGETYDRKPATKLHNAWIAGVPAVLGPESAYRAERMSPADYVEVTTYEQLCGVIDALRGDEGYRERLLAQAIERGERIGFERHTERWIRTIEDVLVPGYQAWTRRSAASRALYLVERWVSKKARGLAARLSRNRSWT